MFAHGKTLKEAVIDLQNKIFENLDTDEKLQEFKKKFNSTDKYLASEFYEWHYLLTGSCEMGRNDFIQRHNIKMTDTFTVKEFVNLCKNAHGGEIIERILEE